MDGPEDGPEDDRLTVPEQLLSITAEEQVVEQTSIGIRRSPLGMSILCQWREIGLPKRRRGALPGEGLGTGQGVQSWFPGADCGADLVTGAQDRRQSRSGNRGWGRGRVCVGSTVGDRRRELAELESRRIALTMEPLGLTSVADGPRAVTLATLLATRSTGRILDGSKSATCAQPSQLASWEHSQMRRKLARGKYADT